MCCPRFFVENWRATQQRAIQERHNPCRLLKLKCWNSLMLIRDCYSLILNKQMYGNCNHVNCEPWGCTRSTQAAKMIGVHECPAAKPLMLRNDCLGQITLEQSEVVSAAYYDCISCKTQMWKYISLSENQEGDTSNLLAWSISTSSVVSSNRFWEVVQTSVGIMHMWYSRIHSHFEGHQIQWILITSPVCTP